MSTDYYGVNATIDRSRTGNEVPQGINGGFLACAAKDYISVAAGVGDTDRVFLGRVRSDAYINGLLSVIYFDDFGTAITIDIGADPLVTAIDEALGANTIAVLTDNLDVATAAGSSSITASTTTAHKHEPLWKQLNLEWDPQCEIALWATFSGNPGTGNLSWGIYFS